MTGVRHRARRCPRLRMRDTYRREAAACWGASSGGPARRFHDQPQCRRNRSSAPSGAPTAEAAGCGHNGDDRQSHVGARGRSADAKSRAHLIIQPSNSDTHSNPALDHPAPFVVPSVASRLNCPPGLGRGVGSLVKDDNSDHWRLTRMHGCTWIMPSGGGTRAYRCSTTTRSAECREVGYRLCGRSGQVRGRVQRGRRIPPPGRSAVGRETPHRHLGTVLWDDAGRTRSAGGEDRNQDCRVTLTLAVPNGGPTAQLGAHSTPSSTRGEPDTRSPTSTGPHHRGPASADARVLPSHTVDLPWRRAEIAQ